MNRNSLFALVCPSCRVGYELIDLEAPHQTNPLAIEQGVLCCPSCHLVAPVCRGFPLFGEARPLPDFPLSSWVTELTTKWFVPEAEYQQFLEAKAERGMLDLYAAFQQPEDLFWQLSPVWWCWVFGTNCRGATCYGVPGMVSGLLVVIFGRNHHFGKRWFLPDLQLAGH